MGSVRLRLGLGFVPSTTGDRRRGRHLDLLGSLLLGSGVLSLLIPMVDAGSGGNRLWWLYAMAALLLAVFCWWGVRTGQRGRQPLLDPRLARTPGYPAGSGIGLVSYIGFTGITLVLALYLQDRLDYSPLRSGLTVTPFASGVAASAVVTGRLVSRIGRWLTVCGLTAVMVGMIATALLLRHTTGDAAIGTATLATIFYHGLIRTDHNDPIAVSEALLAAAGFMLLALLMALAELIRLMRRWHHRSTQPAPYTWPEQHLQHL